MRRDSRMKTFLGKRLAFVLGAALALAPLASPQSSESKPAEWKDALRGADRMLAKGHYAEAKAAYDLLAREASPGDHLLRYKRAFAAAKTGDLATAGSDYAAVANGAKGRLAGSALLHRAEVAQRMGDDPAAESAFTSIGESYVDHPQAAVALTRILAHIGKAKAAGKPVPPGLVRAAEVLASRGGKASGRWRGPDPSIAPRPAPPVAAPPAPEKNPPPAKPKPKKPDDGSAPPKPKKPASGPPPSKTPPPKPRVRPVVPGSSSGIDEDRATSGI